MAGKSSINETCKYVKIINFRFEKYCDNSRLHTFHESSQFINSRVFKNEICFLTVSIPLLKHAIKWINSQQRILRLCDIKIGFYD